MSGRPSDVDRRITHGPIQPTQASGCSWRWIAFWTVVALIAQPAFLWWCGSIR